MTNNDDMNDAKTSMDKAYLFAGFISKMRDLTADQKLMIVRRFKIWLESEAEE